MEHAGPADGCGEVAAKPFPLVIGVAMFLASLVWSVALFWGEPSLTNREIFIAHPVQSVLATALAYCGWLVAGIGRRADG